MKIIKHGKYYVEKRCITCNCCGCELEVEDDDFIDKEELRFSVVGYTRCPECNYTINVIIKEKGDTNV